MTTTTATDFSGARDRLRASLPETLYRALDAYDAFAARPIPMDAPMDAKEFAAWQGGCKAVLAHVEQLLKLAARVGLDLSNPDDGGEEDKDPLAELLACARLAMSDGTGDAEDAPDD